MQAYPKQLILAVWLTAAVVFAGLTGCKTSDRTTGQRLDDHQVARSVKKSLKKEQVYKFPDVKVQAFNGVVELSGFVDTEDQKRRAAEIAQQVPGVRQVVNGLTLKPQEALSPAGRSTGQRYDTGTQQPGSTTNTQRP
jgi:hyperosmotically inducible protein